MFLRIAQEEFIELITSDAAKTDFSSVSYKILDQEFAVISCSVRDRIVPDSSFVKQAFQACWLSNLNTGADLLQKMICTVLLQRLLQ